MSMSGQIASAVRTFTTPVKIDSLLLPLLFDWAEKQGIDARALAAEHGVAFHTDRPVNAEVGMIRRITVHLASMLAAPHLALAVADAAPRGMWGVAEQLARFAPTVGTAMRRVDRYSRLIPPYQLIGWTRDVSDGTVACTYAMRDLAPPFAGRHSNEFAVARLFRFVNELATAPLAARAVWFAHDAAHDERVDLDVLRRHFRTDDVRFGEATSGFSLPADVESLPVGSADPATHRLLAEYAERLLPPKEPREPTEPEEDELLGEVRATVAELLPDGGAYLDDVARKMGTGARTLQRRLTERGLGFGAIVDAVRLDLAKKHLQQNTMSIGEIAFVLGYADGRAFARAFGRLTGEAPQRWRRAARA